jgi:Tol biopolymer transport system component
VAVNSSTCLRMLCFAAPSSVTIRSPALPYLLLDSERAMGGMSFDKPTPLKTPEDRLDSWKEIAAYLNRDVTTVQRWEKREGMPVHRHQHDRMGSVYASRTELDDWTRTRNLRGAEEEVNGMSTPQVVTQQLSAAIRSRRLLIVVAAIVVLAVATLIWARKSEYFWRSPIADASFQPVTDFGGIEQAAALSRDGNLIAFLSDRDGQMDVWVTQVGSGQFHNLTRGSVQELVNPSIRALGFSPDGSLVTFWSRKKGATSGRDISIWAVPTLGGQPRPYLEGAAELDWSSDGTRLAYHTPGPGDPMFVADNIQLTGARPVFTAPAGLHSHFQLWSPDGKFIYFVQGALPDKLDIWRIPSDGGTPERITYHNATVTYPNFINSHTLIYLAGAPDGSGPWLYSIDTERRVPHRLTSGPDRYTSLAAGADGRRLAVTVANPKRTLWRMRLADPAKDAATAISLTTSSGSSPRLGPDFLLYVSTNGSGESIWKLLGGTSTELWNGKGEIVGAPAISRDGHWIAFSIRQEGRARLYVIQSDGTNARIVTDALNLQGDLAWSPDGRSITVAAVDGGDPHLLRVPVDGSAPTDFVQQFSLNPAWSPDGRFVVYSGPDIGTTFPVKAATADAAPLPLPNFNLTRGARHMAVVSAGRALVFLRGEIRHKNLWLLDLESGSERQLTNLPPDFDIRDFDISADGSEAVFERVQDHSDIVLMELPRR